MSFTSTAAPAADPVSIGSVSGMTTVIDANTVVDGTLSTSHDVRVEGRVTGTLMCNGVVHIAEGAEVDATVEAAGIVVSGTLSGEITCHGRLEIRSTGAVRGRVETGRLIVVEGQSTRDNCVWTPQPTSNRRLSHPWKNQNPRRLRLDRLPVPTHFCAASRPEARHPDQLTTCCRHRLKMRSPNSRRHLNVPCYTAPQP